MSRLNGLAPPGYFANFHGRLFGKRRAVVKDVEDPRQLGRVRVLCRSVYGNDLSPWAMPCWAQAGNKGSGSYWVPPVDSIVWLEFEEGITEQPIYTGMTTAELNIGRRSDGSPVEGARGHQADANSTPSHMRGIPDGRDIDGGVRDSASPKSNYAGQYPHVRGWDTPAGHRIELDDTPSGERVLIQHSTGSTYEIQPDGSLHHLLAGGEVRRVAFEDDVVRGDVRRKVEGTQTIDVAGDFVLNVGGSYRVSQGGTSVVESPGGTEVITGAKTTRIQGSMVTDVANFAELSVGSDYRVGVGGDYALFVAGSGDLTFSAVADALRADLKALSITAQGGRAEYVATDATGLVTKYGIEMQPVATGTLAPTAVAGATGPFVRIGNLKVPATGGKVPLLQEPVVMGEQLSLFLNSLMSFLQTWLTDYLTHAHPWFSPSYTSAAMAPALQAQMQQLMVTWLTPTGAKAHTLLQSDVVFVSKT